MKMNFTTQKVVMGDFCLGASGGKGKFIQDICYNLGLGEEKGEDGSAMEVVTCRVC